MKFNVQREFGGRTLSFETGKMARQAAGAVVVSYGETMVLVTACREPEPKAGQDFLPLTVEYKERYYAAGKIPGGFFKREGRPTDRETLTSRLIDRPLRPLFPEGYALETQVVAFVISADSQHDPDILAINGASAALTISDIPFRGPIGAARIARAQGKLVANPTKEQLSQSDLNIVFAASRDAIVMVEGGGNEISEEDFIQATELAHQEILKSIELQLELANLVQPQKMPDPVDPVDHELVAQLLSQYGPAVLEASLVHGKHERSKKLGAIRDQAIAALIAADATDADAQKRKIKLAFKEVESKIMRSYAVRENKRADGRTTTQIRPITIETGVLPRAHGAALFTRGETQALVTVTLGSARDEQTLDNIEGESSERFLLHYNFPPFSVGEVKMMRGPGRREIGHGSLAERAVRPLVPAREAFPYTVRVVSDILESNGSSSMATVCGASLALMDAGVPIRTPVAGIAMGLIKEDDGVAILSDILGVEDHLGDMDFKVAGTAKGITAIQMDIKVAGISGEVLRKALDQARDGRLFILGEMSRALAQSRNDLSRYAPRILSLKINPERIKDVIGPGGKIIKGIIAETGVDIDIEDTGIVNIVSNDSVAAQKARKIIESLTEELEIGKVYLGEVKRIESYGAFVQITPGNEGLLHVTQLADHYIKNVSDELSEGQKIQVKLIDIDKQGRLKLSRKAVVEEGDAPAPAKASEPVAPLVTEEPRPRSERGARGEEVEKSERVSRPERSERPERPSRPERGERSERSSRPERSERPERAERAERPERAERAERPERAERAERPERDRFERPRPEREFDREPESRDRSRSRVREEAPPRSRVREEAPPRAERAPRERGRYEEEWTEVPAPRERVREEAPPRAERAPRERGRYEEEWTEVPASRERVREEAPPRAERAPRERGRYEEDWTEPPAREPSPRTRAVEQEWEEEEVDDFQETDTRDRAERPAGDTRERSPERDRSSSSDNRRRRPRRRRS